MTFIEELNLELKKYSFKIKTNFLLDILLSGNFLDLFQSLDNKLSELRKIEKRLINEDYPSKKPRIEVQKGFDLDLNSDIICWYSKCNKYLHPKMLLSTQDISNIKIENKWRVDLAKCIDASPLVVVKQNSKDQIKVFIGSHSKLFLCVDALYGQVLWRFYAQDRIESSACISKCGNFIVFGNLF